jgi:glycosyl transferase, family 25
MDLLDLFDRVFILNLPSRPDRRQEMVEMLRGAGWDPEGPKLTWFPAVDPRSAAGFSSPGSRGCFVSHIAALNAARNMGASRVLVLEDDCDFAPDFPERQEQVAGWLESAPWGLAYLGHVESVSPPPGLTRWDPGTQIKLTHCYAAAGEALPRLIRYLEAMTLRPAGSREGGPMSPDGGLSWFRRANPDVVTVLVNPSLAHQRPSRSDLTPRWFDRVPGLSSVAAQARVIRRSILRPS